MERSGVYRSTHDLVHAARSIDLEWTALLGMRASAAGSPLQTTGVREFLLPERGRRGLTRIEREILASAEVADADVLVSMITQTDIAVSRLARHLNKPWVAWVRGLPWPAHGEQSLFRRAIIRAMEIKALRSAHEVWATTPVLADAISAVGDVQIVPAGIPATVRRHSGEEATAPVVWAGRLTVDKRPELFAEAVKLGSHPAVMFGEGPLKERIIALDVPGLVVAGWADSSTLWERASIFVGTSSREAFGRSAVEAAAAGLPIIIGAQYGAAPLLVTDPYLRQIAVIDSNDPARWHEAIRHLLMNKAVRQELSAHVAQNAAKLTISSSAQNANARAAKLMGSVS